MPEDPEPELELELCEDSGNGRRREPDLLMLRAGGSSRYGMSVNSPAIFMGWMLRVALGRGEPILLWSAVAWKVYDGEECDIRDVLESEPFDFPILVDSVLIRVGGIERATRLFWN